MFISVQRTIANDKAAIKMIHCVIVAKLVVYGFQWLSVAQCGLGSANNKTTLVIKAFCSYTHNVCQKFTLLLHLYLPVTPVYISFGAFEK